MARTYPHHGLDVELNEADGAVVIKAFKQESEDSDKEFYDERTFLASEIAEALQTWTFLYGVSKILQDRCSGTSVADGKLEEMDEVFSMLKEGKKNRERQVGSPVVSAEVEALAELKGVTIPDIQRSLSKYDADTRKKILSNAQVQAKAQEIKERRASAGDGASLDDLV